MFLILGLGLTHYPIVCAGKTVLVPNISVASASDSLGRARNAVSTDFQEQCPLNHIAHWLQYNPHIPGQLDKLHSIIFLHLNKIKQQSYGYEKEYKVNGIDQVFQFHSIDNYILSTSFLHPPTGHKGL